MSGSLLINSRPLDNLLTVDYRNFRRGVPLGAFSRYTEKIIYCERSRSRKNPTKRWQLIRVIYCFKRFDLARKHQRFTNMYYRGRHPRCPRMDIRRSRVEHGRSKNPDSWRAAEGTDARIYGPLLDISYVLDSMPADDRVNIPRACDLGKIRTFANMSWNVHCVSIRTRIISEWKLIISFRGNLIRFVVSILFSWLNVLNLE